jgi:energy-coupling factor transport system ATP-binding protein
VIEQRRQRGEATILISHDLDLVAEQTERAILLNQGQIVVDGKTERVLSDAPTLALADLQPPEATLIARALGLADEERPIVTTSQLTAALLAKLGAYSPSREW